MKKILYIWKGPYPFEVRIEKICNSLAKFGYDVTILCRWCPNTSMREECGKLHIIRAGYQESNRKYMYLPFNPNWKRIISETIDEVKPDLIINREFYLLTETLDCANRKNIPVIVDMAENYPAALREFRNSQTFLKQLFFRTLRLPDLYEKYCIPKANGVIVVCDEQIPRLRSIGVKEKICVVQNTPVLNFQRVTEKSKSNVLRFVHHGYLSGDKSILEFVKGFLAAAENREDIELIIAGKGECYDLYKSVIEQSKAPKSVKLLGSYENSQLPKILANADIGVLPFKATDFNNFTIQNKIFDYFAAGLPVLVSECKPLMRIIRETNAGWIYDCSSANNCRKAIETTAKIFTAENKSEIKYKENALNAYKSKYNWATDEKNLVEFIELYI